MIWILFLLGMFAHAHLLWRHFVWMWKAEHFQFFPIAFAAAAFLLVSRRAEFLEIRRPSAKGETDGASAPTDTQISGPNYYLIFALLMLHALVLTFAVLAELPLVAWINFLLFACTLVYATYGWQGIRLVIPVMVVLLVIRPLPASLETLVTSGMQRIASMFSSHLLDGLGILHYRQGVVLVLTHTAFMAEEACSGIRSLFSSITAIVFWGLLHRYHWFRHCVNVAQTIFWVIVFNALRITTVVWFEENTPYSLATGTPHSVLGLLVFLLIFAFVVSTDQLLSAFLSPSFAKKEGDETEDSESSKTLISPLTWLQWRGSKSSLYVWIGVFGVILLATVRLQMVNTQFFGSESYSQDAQPIPTANYMPQELAGWSIVGFEHIHREDQHQFGSDSYIWEVKQGARKALLSIDGSFGDYHDLGLCYSMIGWKVQRHLDYPTIPQRIANETGDHQQLTHISLSKVTGETGVVLFTAVDRHGVVVNAPETGKLSERVEHSVRSLLGIQTLAAKRIMIVTPPMSTIQLVYQPSDPITEQDEKEIRELFIAARSILLQSPRFAKK